MEAKADARQKVLRNQPKAAKRIGTLAERLLKELETNGPAIKQAVSRSYLPAGYAPSSSPRTLASLLWLPRQSVRDIRATLADLSRDAREWNESASIASKGRRGRKFPEERVNIVATWVAIRLAAAGIPLRRSANSKLGKVLKIVYKAAGIPQPTNLFRDVAAAIDARAQYLRGGGNFTALPSPPRKPLHKSTTKKK